MTNYMLGVDIGTTSTKAVLFSEHGKVIQQENIGYPFTASYNAIIFSALSSCIALIKISLKSSSGNADLLYFCK